MTRFKRASSTAMTLAGDHADDAPPHVQDSLVRRVIAEATARKKRQAKVRWGVRVATLVVILVAWQLVGANINPLFLSTPTDIVQAFGHNVASGELPKAFELSVVVMAIGFGIALVVGVPLGILMGRARLLELILEPYVNALFVTPRVALIPLILIWFGIGSKAQVFVIFLSSVFPILINSYAGARNVSAQWTETARSFGATPRQEFFQIILPGAVPFIATGVRLGVGHSVIGMVVAEMFLALSGLGGLLVNYGDLFETPSLFSVIIVVAAMGVALTAGVKKLENRFAHWKVSERGHE